ncbi:hypothetical protein TNCV_328541 [Trichonephila clavipes]|nr:hypothetical protein TNCV_328541 [Trichonephila clavipes]
MPQNLLEHVSAGLLRLVGYQSSWRSTEDFQYTRPHLLGRSLSFSFPRSYGLATDWIGDMATGICNDVLGIGSRGTWRKTARRVWSAYFFFSANVVEVPSAVSRVAVKDSLLWQ